MGYARMPCNQSLNVVRGRVSSLGKDAAADGVVCKMIEKLAWRVRLSVLPSGCRNRR